MAVHETYPNRQGITNRDDPNARQSNVGHGLPRTGRAPVSLRLSCRLRTVASSHQRVRDANEPCDIVALLSMFYFEVQPGLLKTARFAYHLQSHHRFNRLVSGQPPLRKAGLFLHACISRRDPSLHQHQCGSPTNGANASLDLNVNLVRCTDRTLIMRGQYEPADSPMALVDCQRYRCRCQTVRWAQPLILNALGR